MQSPSGLASLTQHSYMALCVAHAGLQPVAVLRLSLLGSGVTGVHSGACRDLFSNVGKDQQCAKKSV